MAGIPNDQAGVNKDLDSSCITPVKHKSFLLNEFEKKKSAFLLTNLTRIEENENFWHRFMIYNEAASFDGYKKNFILKVVTDYVYPESLLPVYYTKKGNRFFFLARNCIQAVIKIFKGDFIIPNPKEPNLPFKLSITVNITTINQFPVINVEENIFDILKRRFSEGTLLLDKFYEDKGLKEFCPLNQPKLLTYVLHLALKLEPIKIILSHNDIRSFPSLELLEENNIEAIDLRNNLIESLHELRPLNALKKLKDLNLDGNPVCAKYSEEFVYTLAVKNICRNIQTLDDRSLYQNGFPTIDKTFICDINSVDLTDHFLESYFTLYDQDRQSLECFYDERVLFSLTYKIIRNKDLPPNFRNALHFQIRRRNLLEKLSGTKKYLEQGRPAVIETLKSFPKTKHNPYSFLVDLMVCTASFAVISISGVFREYSNKSHIKQETDYGFSRTFVLKRKNISWLIINDMLHVYHPFSNELNSIPFPSSEVSDIIPQPVTDQNKFELVKTFQAITHLTTKVSEEYLNRMYYNIELALRVFVEECTRETIPNEAFLPLCDEEDENDYVDTCASLVNEVLSEEVASKANINDGEMEDDVVLVESEEDVQIISEATQTATTEKLSDTTQSTQNKTSPPENAVSKKIVNVVKPMTVQKDVNLNPIVTKGTNAAVDSTKTTAPNNQQNIKKKRRKFKKMKRSWSTFPLQ